MTDYEKQCLHEDINEFVSFLNKNEIEYVRKQALEGYLKLIAQTIEPDQLVPYRAELTKYLTLLQLTPRGKYNENI